MEIWGKTFWHWGATLSVHQEALLSYAEAVPLCVLLLCKYRPSDYTGCWAWALPPRGTQRQKHTEFKPSWGSLVEELVFICTREENNVEVMGWSEFQHDTFDCIRAWKGFKIASILKRGGAGFLLLQECKYKLLYSNSTGSIVNHAFDTKRRSHKVG